MRLQVRHSGWTVDMEHNPHDVPTETVPLRYFIRQCGVNFWELKVVHKEKGYGGIHMTWDLDPTDRERVLPIQGETIACKNCIAVAWRMYRLNKF